MRRTLAVAVSVVAILGLLAPVASAQAPAPKVTIVGLFDQITSFGRNIYDGDFSRTGETEWYARARFRPDFTFEVGRTKAVMGLEFDAAYGQFATARAGTTNPLSGRLNTDVAGVLELKWWYTEFDLFGKDSLLPFIPVATRARAGAQPFGALANYKATYANGDFAGLSMVSTWAPNLRSNFAYVQVENYSGAERRAALNRTPSPPGHLGNDYAIILSIDLTPFKGLDIKPLYSYFHAEGTTNAAARRVVSNLNTVGGTTGGAAAFRSVHSQEDRHTLGIDARWRSGPFSFDPTIMFQTGNRESLAVVGGHREAKLNSWLIDLTGGWRMGPLLLEGRLVYTTGNEAQDDLSRKIRYFEPLDLDTGYWAGWANIQALGIDYFNGGGGTLRGMSTNIGYDRYGRLGLGFRARYSVTPALSFYGVVSPTWTAEKVDTHTTATRGQIAGGRGDSRYIGTETDLGMTWRFAPNTTFDLVGAYLFAGGALDTGGVDSRGIGVGGVRRSSRDGYTVAARVRFAF